MCWIKTAPFIDKWHGFYPSGTSWLRSPHRAQLTARAGALPQGVVRPLLHHLASLGEALCFVVSRPHLVALGVRELQLDDVRRIALLVEERARHTSKSMPGLLVARVAQPAQRRVEGVVGHGALATQERGGDVATASGQRLEL